mgnify:CR=1 FL=1
MKNNIKKLRNELKISQKDLAESLNVSRQTINAIETGKFDPSLTLTIKITRFFNKNLEEIFSKIRSAAAESAREHIQRDRRRLEMHASRLDKNI